MQPQRIHWNLYLSITAFNFVNAGDLQKELANFAIKLHMCLVQDPEKLKEIW